MLLTPLCPDPRIFGVGLFYWWQSPPVFKQEEQYCQPCGKDGENGYVLAGLDCLHMLLSVRGYVCTL